MNQLPSVTMLSREYPPRIYGGAGVHVQYLASALSALTQVEVRAFGPGVPEGPVPASFFTPETPWLAGADPRLALVLGPLQIDLAMVAPPIITDLVHCHTWYAIFAGLLARLLYGTAFVATVHSLEPLRPWKEEQLGRGYLLSTWMERTGLLAADLVIAVSQEMRSDIIAAYPVHPDRIIVIHNGIDLARFQPRPRPEVLAGRGIRAPYVLFVGRVSRQKGLDVLLTAARELPEDLLVVVCAGAADTPQFAAEMREAALAVPSVRWIEEMLPPDELVALYSQAEIFVCPSIYEPFGLINLEAMACGRPVVASRVGGIPEVVVDGETGLLIAPGDPAALVRAVKLLLAQADRAAAMGRAGRRRVEAHFTWEAIAQQTLAAYSRAVADSRAHKSLSSQI